MASVSFDKVTKTYPGNHSPAVESLTLDVVDGEFLVLVGPSGCGKSTILRLIAGLEQADDGKIFIDDTDVTDQPARTRDIAMVFQNYALYPHLTVRENMSFALKNSATSQDEIDSRVREAAKILELDELLDRKPRSLSGGQRQRVAMGRAIVRHPRVFLMDEPLSNLDSQLRTHTRTQIAALQRALGVTTIYVTHDQTEAMTMADRLVILDRGAIQQIGTPQEVFDCPSNTFVASFIGTPPMNLLPLSVPPAASQSATFSSDNDNATMARNVGTTQAVDASKPSTSSFSHEDGTPALLSSEHREVLARLNLDSVIVGVRPEGIEIVDDSQGHLRAHVELIEHMGADSFIHAVVDDAPQLRVVIRADAHTKLQRGEIISLSINPDHIHLFHPETQQRLN